MKLSENPNVKKLIDNAFKLGKEQAEKDFLEMIDEMQKDYEIISKTRAKVWEQFGENTQEGYQAKSLSLQYAQAVNTLKELKKQLGGKTR